MACSFFINSSYWYRLSAANVLCVILLVLLHDGDFVGADKSQDRHVQSKKFVRGFVLLEVLT